LEKNSKSNTGLKKGEFNKFMIGLSAGSHFVTDLYQNFYVGLIPLLSYNFGLSLFKVSLLGATSVIANSLFAPLFGYLSDRHGTKYFIVAGPLVASIFLSTIGLIPNYWVLLMLLFCGNLGISAYHPASASMAGHYGGQKKGFGTSLINFGGNFGSAFGSLLVILILKKIGINYTVFAVIPGIITAIILFKYLPSRQYSATTSKISELFIKLKKMSPKKLFLVCNLVFSVYSLYIVWITLMTYMPLHFTEAKTSLINVGIILFLYGALGGGGGFISGMLYDKFKKGYILIQAGLICAIPLLFFIFQAKGIAAPILFILSGFFLISIQPVCLRMAQDMLPGNMSLASSLILGLSSGLAGVTVIFLGKAADIIGISMLIRLELILLFAAFLLLFGYPFVEQKLKSNQPSADRL
jgi:FSR family fosmidomycin resistance protein-like MFS transporter